MNFKPYEILSTFIPGVIIVFIIVYLFDMTVLSNDIIAYSAFAFVVGYILNLIGSLLEGFYFWTWGGVPSCKLLKGKKMGKVRLYNHKEIKKMLITKSSNDSACTKELFGIAMSIAFSDKNNRLEDFSNSYAFSRTILTCSIFSSIFLFIKHPCNWYVCLSIPVILLFWYGAKQRGYYFSKEVLQVFFEKEMRKK